MDFIIHFVSNHFWWSLLIWFIIYHSFMWIFCDMNAKIKDPFDIPWDEVDWPEGDD